jgi:Domain of unknown function (DUF6265)
MPRVALFAVLACASIIGRSGVAADVIDVNQLGWLEGSWVGQSDGTEIEEHWTSVRGGALLGMHRDISARRMSSFEFLRIQTTTEGTFYFASPRSAPPVAFKLIEMSARTVEFENKLHDFPQRIRYWLDASDILHARVEGKIEGNTVAEEWAWRRVHTCGAIERKSASVVRSNTLHTGTAPP